MRVYIALLLALIGFPVVVLLVLISVLVYRMQWAVRVPPEQLPFPLGLRHNDYAFWPLTRMPRSWTAFLCDKGPRQIAGTNPPEHHTDIPADATWSLTWPFHFAITSRNGWLFHIGMRFDYQPESYYNIAVALKRYRDD